MSIEEQKKHVLEVLRTCKVDQLEVVFDGCGDSGSIEHVYYTPAPTVDGIGHTKESLRKLVEDLAYAWLDLTGIDWYNNDGGYGSMVLDTKTGEYKLTVNQRYIECTTGSFS